MPIRAVLFDLDGTLLDTVPDLVFALNQLRNERGILDLTITAIRRIASLGSRAFIKKAFDLHDDHPELNTLREKFLTLYLKHLADTTTLFPEIDNVLLHLEQQNIPWGIVTNKLTKHTTPLLKALRLDQRTACVICGDSLSKAKPDPLPLLHACELLKQAPQDCLYIGDAETDVHASKAAGLKSLVAMYGYIGENENPLSWQADGYIQSPKDILTWL